MEVVNDRLLRVDDAEHVQKVKERRASQAVAAVRLVRALQAYRHPRAKNHRMRAKENCATQCWKLVANDCLEGVRILRRGCDGSLPAVVLLVNRAVQKRRRVQQPVRGVESDVVEEMCSGHHNCDVPERRWQRRGDISGAQLLCERVEDPRGDGAGNELTKRRLRP